MPALRPLPPQPNLQFEKKEAKALLRRLRAGDANALARARARHPSVDASTWAGIRLADAQLVIAREYGFASWPKLVRYFGDLRRQSFNYGAVQYRDRRFFEQGVRELLAGHGKRVTMARRELAKYVPRFYGMALDEVLASDVTEDEARLAVARSNGYPSWELLLERCETEIPRKQDDWHVHPLAYASKAMEAGDLEALERLVQRNPELVHPTDWELAKGGTLLGAALAQEQLHGRAVMRPVMDWLAAQGLDLQLELNRQLCGRMLKVKTEKVRWLLDRGADPNWIAPNGIPVLEHALIRYWNGEAVDLIAARVKPRKALWIAAGLGDVESVRRSLDAQGRPRPAAVRLRPDFDAVDHHSFPSHPDPDDEEILLEAFWIAMLNGRTAVLEYMVSRGFPVDTLMFNQPPIFVAVGNAMVPVVECLVRCGANLDLKGRHPRQSAREIAAVSLALAPQDEDRRRVAELCGMDPDAMLAELDAKRERPRVDPKFQEALELAGDDAFRCGQSDIRPENLLFGLLRGGGSPLTLFAKVSRMDLDRFRTDVWERVRYGNDRANRPRLTLHRDAQTAVQAAIDLATEHRRETVQGIHLLYALTSIDGGVAAELLARYGSSAETLNARLERSL